LFFKEEGKPPGEKKHEAKYIESRLIHCIYFMWCSPYI